MTTSRWALVVDELFRETTGCSWVDLCGDDEPIESACARGETPEQFVNYWIEKYDLTRIDDGKPLVLL